MEPPFGQKVYNLLIFLYSFSLLYLLEVPQWSVTNEYPKCMFLWRNKNTNRTSAWQNLQWDMCHQQRLRSAWCSLIRVFAERMCLLRPPDYPKKDKWELLPYWVDVEAYLNLCWSHRSYCRFCHPLAQFWYFSLTSSYTVWEQFPGNRMMMMMMMMIWYFMSLWTLFKSEIIERWLKCSVQWSAIQSWDEFHVGFETGTSLSKVGSTNHSFTLCSDHPCNRAIISPTYRCRQFYVSV